MGLGWHFVGSKEIHNSEFTFINLQWAIKKSMSKQYDLEERLLDYAAAIISVTEQMKPTRAGNHVAGQLLRSGTSPLFNHGEAEGAESPRDFSRKLSICLKELKESRRGLRLAVKVPLIDDIAVIDPVLVETDELIRIFGAAIRTTRKNLAREDSPEYGKDSDGGDEATCP